jgi:hypothetical protein
MNDALDELERIVDSLPEDTDLFDRVGRDFIHLLEAEGFEVIGTGGSRIVVGLEGVVAKIDASASAGTNSDELSVWEEFAGQLPLAPILGERSGGRILVMARAELVFDQLSNRKPKKISRKHRKAIDAGKAAMEAALPVQVDWQYDFNWGVLDGDVVCIDYGS